MKNYLLPITVSGLGLAAMGCANLDSAVPPADATQTAAIVKQSKEFKPVAEAGVPPDTAPPTEWATLLASHAFSTRPDPFALHPKEVAYEHQQAMERAFSTTGGFSVNFIPTVETVVLPVVEPQPYRRLAGVIVGDSVLALIDMGDGRIQLIRPGQVIEGWTVASIDADKAILRRSGNRLPHEVIVRLESAPFGAPNQGGSRNAPGTSGPGGGTPGGPNKGGGGKPAGGGSTPPPGN